jgi:hypothetical protein
MKYMYLIIENKSVNLSDKTKMKNICSVYFYPLYGSNEGRSMKVPTYSKLVFSSVPHT